MMYVYICNKNNVLEINVLKLRIFKWWRGIRVDNCLIYKILVLGSYYVDVVYFFIFKMKVEFCYNIFNYYFLF